MRSECAVLSHPTLGHAHTARTAHRGERRKGRRSARPHQGEVEASLFLSIDRTRLHHPLQAWALRRREAATDCDARPAGRLLFRLSSRTSRAECAGERSGLYIVVRRRGRLVR